MAGSKKPWIASRHPAKELKRLLGRWSVEAIFPGEDKALRGSATFEWLVKNALMVQRSRMPKPIPNSVSVLGADDVFNEYTMLYSDARGVTREYGMRLTRTTLTFERRAPRFWQRFRGHFAGNSRRIVGAWEKSTDGRRWEHDFKLVYKKQ